MSSLDRILPFLKPIEDLLCDPTITEVMASAEEWAAIREIQERLPEAHTVLRHHLLLSKRHQGVPSIVIIGALVTLKHGPFVLRREYIVSDRQSAAAPAPEVDHN